MAEILHINQKQSPPTKNIEICVRPRQASSIKPYAKPPKQKSEKLFKNLITTTVFSFNITLFCLVAVKKYLLLTKLFLSGKITKVAVIKRAFCLGFREPAVGASRSKGHLAVAFEPTE